MNHTSYINAELVESNKNISLNLETEIKQITESSLKHHKQQAVASDSKSWFLRPLQMKTRATHSERFLNSARSYGTEMGMATCFP